MDSRFNYKNIRLVILDIDGVLTDGRIGYGCGSDEEIKFFNVKDGAGIRLLQKSGIKVGVLSGRRSQANQRRARELALDFIKEGFHRKTEAFAELLTEHQVEARQCLYIGDDLIDLPIMRLVGISVAVADAAPEVLALADWHCTRPGGQGAVRETAEKLLKLQGKWIDLLHDYDN